MSAPDTGRSVWVPFTASVRGARHVRNDLVNQDAVATTSIDGPSPLIVAAVADGHGGARYVRSQVGAQLAVDLACRVAVETAAALTARSDRRQIEKALGQIMASLVGHWRAAVHEHVAQTPFTEGEARTAGSDLTTEPLVSYGCTLLLAVAGAGWVGLAQVGDGDALVVEPDGATSCPVPGDDRLVAGETTSLCLPTVERDARYAVVLSDRPMIVILATDGYGNSFASSDWRRESGEGFAELLRTSGPEVIAARLPEWLGESAEVGGDDVTMAVLTRREGGGAAAPAATASVEAPVDDGRRSRGAVAVGAALACLLVGGLIGWLVGSAQEDSSPANGPVSRVTDEVTTTVVTVSTAPPPTGSTTLPGSPPVPAAQDRLVIVAPGGLVVEFAPVIGDPDPVVVQERPALTPTTALWWTGADWSIEQGGQGPQLFRSAQAGSTATGVPLDGTSPGGLLVAPGGLWVVSSDGRSLAVVDADGQLVNGWFDVEVSEQ